MWQAAGYSPQLVVNYSCRCNYVRPFVTHIVSVKNYGVFAVYRLRFVLYGSLWTTQFFSITIEACGWTLFVFFFSQFRVEPSLHTKSLCAIFFVDAKPVCNSFSDERKILSVWLIIIKHNHIYQSCQVLFVIVFVFKWWNWK